MARKIPAKMKPYLKFGYACAKEEGVKPFKKQTAAEKKAINACVIRKERAARMRAAGK